MENIEYMLPEDFLKNMKELLGNDFENFINSYKNEKYVGLRYNPLKADRETFLANVPFTLSPVDWAEEGFYYDPDEHPGRSVLHEAGAFYIQEPSAMSAVSVLQPEPGDYVLDLCAAPGGKTTQIAGRLLGKGLLVSNEYVKDRAHILSQNVERMGVPNALVLNESAEKLASHFPSFFDKILVDAPCSGEGMFKKEEHAIDEWSIENVNMCHERQLSILDEAALMLKPGGTLTYSTCTFNNIENEGSVNAFLEEHPEFTLIESKRLWPHIEKGEGHFVAKFVKAGELSENKPVLSSKNKSAESLLKDITTFLTDEIGMHSEKVSSLLANRRPITFGENIYLLPEGIENLGSLKVERPGLHIAVSKKNRYEPSHSLALSLKSEDVKCSFALSDDEALKYIKGETINCDSSLKGWVLLTTRGFSIGFGKASNGIIKNHYPKGLRK